MKALVFVSLLALPLAQSAPRVDVHRMIEAGDFKPHYPTVADIKREYPAAEGFGCGGDRCYSVRVGAGRWLVFHVTSEEDTESAEVSEIAELGFAPARSLGDQKAHMDAARMDLAGLHLGDPVANLQDMRRSSPADTKSMASCEFDMYERFVGMPETNLRYSVCIRNGRIAALAFSDPE